MTYVGRWVVSTKGAPGDRAFEISIVREDNKHGLASYGWFDDAKLLVSHNGAPCEWPITKRVWDGLVILAHTVAIELNAAEESK